MTPVRRLLAALLVLVAAPGIALASAPSAGAATCTSAGGVSVVVDYRELGGGIVTACSADGGGKSAAAIFASVGVGLTYATRQPGFVCRVNGVPTSDPCVNASPANAYWGLWWADGTKSSWTYSSYGVGSLTVPAGGSVGWSWQQDRAAGASVPPGIAAPVTASSSPSPSPSPSPTSSPTSSSSPSPTSSPTTSSSGSSSGSTSGPSSGSSGTASPSPSSSPTSKPSGGASGSTSPEASPSGSPSASGTPLAPESLSDSREEKRDGKADAEDSEDPSGLESPSDSTESADPGSGAESPSDSSPSAGDIGADPASAGADQPSRVPAAVTWTVVALLAIAIAVSGLVARRRRGV